MKGLIHAAFRGAAVLAVATSLAVPFPVSAQPITLHGAVQFNDDHAFNKALLRFEELVKKYYGKPINFVLHRNSELGLEKQYFEYMAQGKAVDYAIVSPAHMSTFSKAAPFIDAPFLFRDLAHWNKVLDADLLKPVADEIAQKADVMLIGYAGGGTRNIFVNKPVRNLAEIKGLKVRVQGAPIWSKTFSAAGMAPTVIAYNEVYNAIQNGVIAAGENEAAGVETMKFYEVAPHLAMTQHAITIRPICFSGKTFKKLPADLQAAIIKAGKEAGAYGRQIESSEDEAKLVRHGEGRKAQARPVRRPRGDEEGRRSGDGRVREGNRRGRDLPEDQRDQVTHKPGRAHARPECDCVIPAKAGIQCRYEAPRRRGSSASIFARPREGGDPCRRAPRERGFSESRQPEPRKRLMDEIPPLPRSAWRRFTALYASLLSWLLVATIAILVFPVSLQIFSRYTELIPSYIWTEELARFVFIWAIMLGAMLGIKEGTHFVVDVWPRLSLRAAALLDLLGNACVLVFALVFVWYGIEFTQFAWGRISELAELPLWLIHVAWPLAGVTWIAFGGERMLRDLRILFSSAVTP